MNDKHMKDALENLARRGVPEDINLWPNISARLERKSLIMTLRTRPVFALLLILLALALISSVAYAIGKVTGYVPGIGLVDQSISIRVLEKPIKIKQEGLTIRVLKVVADATQTFVTYSVSGIPVRMDSPSTCGLSPMLRLTNGTELKVLNDRTGGGGSENGSPMSYEAQISYAPMPADVKDVVIVFPCILPIGKGPENWQIKIHLTPAPKNFVTPAVEIGATFIASKPTFVISSTPTIDMRIFTPEPPDTLPATLTPVPNGSGLYLERVIELPNSYILVGTFRDAGDLPGALEVKLDPYEDLPHMEDKSGNRIAFKVRDDIQHENMQSGIRYWAFEIAKPVQAPLTITLDQVNIAKSYTFEFHFDAGANPQKGQKWDLNLPVHLGSYEYIMDSVEAIENGYLFKYHSGTDVPEGGSLMFNLIGHTPEQGSSELRSGKTIVEYSEKLVFLRPLPTGQLTIDLTLMETFPLQGPWTLTWTPPGK